MKAMWFLEGGQVVCPATGINGRFDVLIDEDLIVSVLPEGQTDLSSADGDIRRLDCSGFVVAPGFVDLVAEVCDPGMTWREDLGSASEAAAAGGFTTVVASPKTDPVVDDPSVASDVIARSSALSGARILQAGALTTKLEGEQLAEVGSLLEAGCVAISDGGRQVPNAAVLRRGLSYARPFNAPVFLRPGESTLESEGCMHEGLVSLQIGLRGIPAEAEEIGVSRLVALARLTGARLHLTHVTSIGGLRALEAGRKEGLSITGTVPARHLVLQDRDVKESIYDTRLRLLPPLRSAPHQEALIAAVRSGLLAGVVSDHVPWSRVEKELEFAYAKSGATGLETALSATLYAMEGDVIATVKALSIGPAQVIGFVPRIEAGAVADLVVFDPKAQRTVTAPKRSRGVNEPLEGRTLLGEVQSTMVGGKLVFGPIAS